ncbi:hypothetical protein V6Z11_D01G179600 [Gossypium hirsutum]
MCSLKQSIVTVMWNHLWNSCTVSICRLGYLSMCWHHRILHLQLWLCYSAPFLFLNESRSQKQRKEKSFHFPKTKALKRVKLVFFRFLLNVEKRKCEHFFLKRRILFTGHGGPLPVTGDFWVSGAEPRLR